MVNKSPLVELYRANVQKVEEKGKGKMKVGECRMDAYDDIWWCVLMGCVLLTTHFTVKLVACTHSSATVYTARQSSKQ